MSSQNARGDQGYVVQITPGSFNPRVLQILAGNTVTWINYDESVHTVTADDESFDSGDIKPGQSFSVVVTTPGDHPYHCKYDPSMVGLLKVTGIR
jgi:plastocyanin